MNKILKALLRAARSSVPALDSKRPVATIVATVLIFAAGIISPSVVDAVDSGARGKGLLGTYPWM